MPRKVQNMLTQFYRWWPNMAHAMWKKFVSSGEGESFNNLTISTKIILRQINISWIAMCSDVRCGWCK